MQRAALVIPVPVTQHLAVQQVCVTPGCLLVLEQYIGSLLLFPHVLLLVLVILLSFAVTPLLQRPLTETTKRVCFARVTGLFCVLLHTSCELVIVLLSQS